MESSVMTGIIPISKNVVQLMQNRIEEVESSATQLAQVTFKFKFKFEVS